MRGTLPNSLRTPSEQVFRLIVKNAMLNRDDPQPRPSPPLS